MKKISSLLLAGAALARISFAVETHFWEQTDQSDFEKGTLSRLSVRSDGRLFLAPEFREIFDPSTAYLWALASDAKGNLYTGGGGSGAATSKLFMIDPQGHGRVLAELDGLEIHAIAIDRSGNIYAATDPDGKIFKVTPQGKSQLFFDPHEKYIWALAFNSQGDLFAATGDQGNIYRIRPDGTGSVFFKTGETHARSMVIDARDNIIVGTEPGGLIMRVSSAGQGFVLYQTPKREITAVAVSKTGEIYAAAVGSRTSVPASSTSIKESQPPSTTTPLAAPPPPKTNPPSQPSSVPPPPISGGSELYRINTDDSPRRVWTNSQDAIYAIAFDSSGRPLMATGNRGNIYRLDSDTLNTLLIAAAPTQITSFAATPAGRLFVATANIGGVSEVGPKTASKGTFDSDILDAGSFAYWGRLSFRGTPADVTIMTRSGNLSRPEENWSAWTPLKIERDEDGVAPCARCLSGRVASPAARFLQYKINLASTGSGPAPEISSVEIAYLPKNVAPTIDEIEITPPNYKFPPAVAPTLSSSTSPGSITLPPLGAKRPSSSSLSLDLGNAQTLTYVKGMIGARWSASDEDGDTLIYKVEIRGVGESSWQLLKDKVHEKYLSWDSTAFPDGEYEVRLTASDSPSNTPAEALTAVLVSDPFLIDNTPPRMVGLSVAPGGGRLQVRWKAVDARSIIDRAEYSLNGGDWITVEPTTKLSDSPEEEYMLSLERDGPGEQTIAVRVTDSYDNQAVDKVVIK